MACSQVAEYSSQLRFRTKAESVIVLPLLATVEYNLNLADRTLMLVGRYERSN